MIADSKFRCTVTGKTRYISLMVICNVRNVVILTIKHASFKVQIIEQMFNNNQFCIEGYYGNKKNIGRRNYLLACMEWITLIIYIVWKGKAIENNYFWTDVWHF